MTIDLKAIRGRAAHVVRYQTDDPCPFSACQYSGREHPARWHYDQGDKDRADLLALVDRIASHMRNWLIEHGHETSCEDCSAQFALLREIDGGGR